MINTLYKCFRHWTSTGSCFIFSDTHFEDPDCKLMDPAWITPKEQIDRINKLVHKNDTLILLGDIGNIEWVKQLKAGYKVLITGNHDLGAENYKRVIINKTFDTDKYTYNEVKIMMYEKYPAYNVSINKQYNLTHAPFEYYNVIIDNKLFDEIYTGPLMISDKIILSHEPVPNIDWALNLCGHDHSGRCNDKYHYCVCSNIINYTPVNLKEIINSGILKQIDSLHRITINNAAKYSLKLNIK